ncbi:MAG: hypothetical protein U9Q97_04170 [Acidobacteriota bacterium]|nr:hypothetical protein [Acidobacteriota bacterium]
MKNKKITVTRRDFIRGSVGATIGFTLLGPEWLKGAVDKGGRSSVVVVRDKNAMDTALNVDKNVLEKMLEQTLTHVTGKNNMNEAWLKLVSPGDIIGLVPTPLMNPTHDELIDVVKAWPLSPPPICVEAADKVYNMGTSNLENIDIQTIGWAEDSLI